MDKLIGFLFSLSGVALGILIVIGGFQMVSTSGEPVGIFIRILVMGIGVCIALGAAVMGINDYLLD